MLLFPCTDVKEGVDVLAFEHHQHHVLYGTSVAAPGSTALRHLGNISGKFPSSLLELLRNIGSFCTKLVITVFPSLISFGGSLDGAQGAGTPCDS